MYVLRALTFRNSGSAHNAFMCFAWILEQTAIFSLYSINLSVFITEAVKFTAQYDLGL